MLVDSNQCRFLPQGTLTVPLQECPRFFANQVSVVMVLTFSIHLACLLHHFQVRLIVRKAHARWQEPLAARALGPCHGDLYTVYNICLPSGFCLNHQGYESASIMVLYPWALHPRPGNLRPHVLQVVLVQLYFHVYIYLYIHCTDCTVF